VREPFAGFIARGDFFEPKIDLGRLFGEAAGPKPVDEDACAVGFGGLFVDAFESDSQVNLLSWNQEP